jgi:hypothetical protein
MGELPEKLMDADTKKLVKQRRASALKILKQMKTAFMI